MKCIARTKAGKPCRARATANGKCALHADPERAAKLARERRDKRNRHEADPADVALEVPKSAGEIKSVLGKAMAEVYGGRLDTKVATTLAYVGNVLLRAIEVGDLEERIKRLEEVGSGTSAAR